MLSPRRVVIRVSCKAAFGAAGVHSRRATCADAVLVPKAAARHAHAAVLTVEMSAVVASNFCVAV